MVKIIATNGLEYEFSIIRIMKTKVELTHDNPQSELKKGDKGYIDGYVRGADSRSYAVVVVKDKIDLVPIYYIKVI